MNVCCHVECCNLSLLMEFYSSYIRYVHSTLCECACVCSRCNPAVLTDKDCENVYELVYSSHRGVAQAAGEFLNAKLFVHELDETTKNLRTLKGKKRSENTSRLRDLILFFIESEVRMN